MTTFFNFSLRLRVFARGKNYTTKGTLIKVGREKGEVGKLIKNKKNLCLKNSPYRIVFLSASADL
jgi:hypothetical protein